MEYQAVLLEDKGLSLMENFNLEYPDQAFQDLCLIDVVRKYNPPRDFEVRTDRMFQ